VPAFLPSEEFNLLTARDDYLISRQMLILGLKKK
jgi:hypothetical protein